MGTRSLEGEVIGGSREAPAVHGAHLEGTGVVEPGVVHRCGATTGTGGEGH